MVSKGVVSSGEDSRKLSQEQKEIYLLLTEEYLTQKQIASRRGTTPQAVSKIVKKLKEKGYLKKGLIRGCLNTPHVSMKGLIEDKIITKEWRLHGLHFVIKPYYFYPRYEQIRLNQGNYGIRFKGWTFTLHPDMIEMQMQEHEEYSHPDKWMAKRLAEQDVNRVLSIFSNKYGFEVFKEGKANIKLVNGHLARNPSEIADARDGEYLSVRGLDGKIWFTIDKSKGAEHEYVHSQRQYTDSEKIEPYLNDMLYKQPATLSQLQELIKEIAIQNKETAAGLNAIVTIMRSGYEQKEKDNKLANYFG